MRQRMMLLLAALLVAGSSSPGRAEESPLGISGEWSGTCANSKGVITANFLSATEHPDGRLTGKWGEPSDPLTIEKGERVTPDTLQWESPSGKARYRVRCTQKGESLVIDWTYTSSEDGKVRGHSGTTILVRK